MNSYHPNRSDISEVVQLLEGCSLWSHIEAMIADFAAARAQRGPRHMRAEHCRFPVGPWHASAMEAPSTSSTRPQAAVQAENGGTWVI